MDLEEWSRTQRRTSNPKCVICDIMTEPSIIYQSEDVTVHGWRCPQCGFAFIHPKEIPKALEVLKEVARVF
jgi:hypothetical protein